MNKKKLYTLIISLFLLLHCAQAQRGKLEIVHTSSPGAFALAYLNAAPPVVVDTADAEVVRIAARAAAADLELVSGAKPAVVSETTGNATDLILAGTLGHSAAIDELVKAGKLSIDQIRNKRESFVITTVNLPMKGVKQALVIAGSDKRGTAYGLFELSRAAGVSPWVWWADAMPVKSKTLSVLPGTYVSAEPAVRYRGIFLNDEDWGLQPWAAKTFEPETGDIGPKTYAKIFELLLRLRANLIWPAMHPSTKPFYQIPGNAKVAADYAIIVGSSHAEPMLRNNVGEWDEKTMGHFNYVSNKAVVQKYWEDRVKESSGNEAMYSLGMRGVHDSKMEGVSSSQEAVPLLEQIFADQRAMLQKHINPKTEAVPQVFTAYKEVLEIYDNGLKLPDDVTLVWPDDNYGYIQRLNNQTEQVRPGGSGVYYHASYWGRPHDYLWLSSTHPALLREEMMKAYGTGADRLWVLNAGDIKPLEYNIELFLDMAYNAKPFADDRSVKTHLANWLRTIFGQVPAPKLATVLWRYYQLAFERRPEFMGWSQTEPTTQTKYTGYNHFYYGDEAQKRIDDFDRLEEEARALRKQVAAKDADAFYQLVYYPVMGASRMSKKFLYRDKAYLYARQNRLSAADYAVLSKQMHDSIVAETTYYNAQLAGGKWKHMMSWAPRNLPVFQPPVLPETTVNSSAVWGVAPEGFVRSDSSLVSADNALRLPGFEQGSGKTFFVDVFLQAGKVVDWKAVPSANWIRLSKQSGCLKPEFGKKETRLWVSVDWNKAPAKKTLEGNINFVANGKTVSVQVLARLQKLQGASADAFVETNGFVSIHAANFHRQTGAGQKRWQVVEGLGHTGRLVEALPLQTEAADTTQAAIKAMPSLAYEFYTVTPAAADVIVYTLPTHPVHKLHSLRYAVSVDDSPAQVVDFKTVGRSEEWKQNVLSNAAVRKIGVGFLPAGKHRLKIYMIDPGVLLDRILIDTGGLKKAYRAVAETKAVTSPR